LTKELEIAAAAAVAGLSEAGPGSPPDGHCRNCAAPLRGPWCHGCGQRADGHHRSILRLAMEAIEGLTDLDGRVATTLPALLFRPGRLAADYVQGRLNRHIPPLRLFLVSLLIFTLSLEFVVNEGLRPAFAQMGPGASRNVDAFFDPSRNEAAAALANKSATGAPAEALAEVRRDKDFQAALKDKSSKSTTQLNWLREHITRAVKNPQYYLQVVFEWAHRLAFLLLPIFAAELTLLYVYRRRFFVYDHLLVAMQYLSFCFLLWAGIWLLPSSLQSLGWTVGLVWTPANLYLTLRGAYASSVIGAVIKALFLWLSTLMVFLLLIVGLLALALGQM
jgi:hypothetical protein